MTTGSEDKMATSNEVTMVAYGNKGVSEPVVLGSGREGQYFQRSSTDEFQVHLGSSKKLGKLYKIRIGHSDEDSDAGWFLEKVANLVCTQVLG